MSHCEEELRALIPNVEDAGIRYVRPGAYCLLLIQKLAIALEQDGSEIDWDEISSMMADVDPTLCKLMFNWMKESFADKIPLVFRGCQIPTLSVVSASFHSTSSVSNVTSNDGRTSSTSISLLPSTSGISGSSNMSSLFSLNSAIGTVEKAQSVSTVNSEVCGSESNSFELHPCSSSWYSGQTDPFFGPMYSQESIDAPRIESLVESSSETSTSPSDRKVCVLVKDAGRNAEKTFYCTCSMLATYMPFFEKRFEEVDPDGDVEISIHVDLTVFEKLLAYIQQVMNGDEQNYKIDPDYAIHLLVSAEFLHMTPLVDKCLDYCYRHLSSIVKSYSPLAAMNNTLVEKLAEYFNHRELEAIVDPKDKMKSKLYKKLLDKLLIPDDESPGHPGTPKLYKCSLCEQIFATKLQYSIPCRHKKKTLGSHGQLIYHHKRKTLGSHGQLIYHHKRDTNWNIEQYLDEQIESAGSWRRVYWRVWGLVSILHCNTCTTEFCCADFTRCRCHKQPLQFPPSDGEQSSLHQLGTFPCCGRTSYKFDPLDPLHVFYGCAYKNHTVRSGDRPGDIFQDMLSYYDLIYQTRPAELNSFEYSGLQRIVPIFSDKVINDWSILLGNRLPKPRKVPPKKSGAGEMVAETLAAGPEPFVSVLSTVNMPSKAFNIKPAWKMRTTHWHNQDVVRDHDNFVMERLMAQLQKNMPATRTRHSARK